MRPDTIVTFLWTPRPGYRSEFGPAQVNVVAAMVRRHYPHPHRFVCITDSPDGLDRSVEWVKAWNDYADVPSPHGGKNPSCYRRLRMYHPEIGDVLGRRFVSLDLDCVITGDLTPLWDRPEDVVLWGDTNPQPGSHYNGSMQEILAGSRPRVWTEFNPHTSPDLALQAKSWGSDQGWLSYILGPHEAKWTKADGVYSYRNDIQRHGNRLPADARIVFFHGNKDPWMPDVQDVAPWVRQHYRADEAVPA